MRPDVVRAIEVNADPSPRGAAGAERAARIRLDELGVDPVTASRKYATAMRPDADRSRSRAVRRCARS
jgi:hypothetical protein